MKKTKTEKILNITLPIITVIAVIAIWEIAALSMNNSFVLPDVSETAKEFFKLFISAEFYVSLSMTVLRSVISFVLSFLIAGIFAVLTARYKYAGRIIRPIIGVTRALPTVAVVLLLLLWTNSFIAPVVVTMLVVLPTAYVNILNSLSSVDKDVLEACRIYKVSKKNIFFKVELPQITPPLLYAMGSGLSLNIKLMVAAEVLSSTARSLGNMINLSNYNLEVANMMALVVVAVIIGMIAEGVFSILSRKAGKWQ